MQIMITFIVSAILLILIIYKINNRFQMKEFLVFIGIVIVSITLTWYFLEENKNKVPQLFKTKYEKDKGVKIDKLSFERVNNKTLSSNTNFIYNFDFIVLKDGKEFVCTIKNVKIRKIEDEFIFDNYDNLKQECKEN
ncbi:MAG: hypothetical protein ACNI25_10200 [Halarcobacter sp.]